MAPVPVKYDDCIYSAEPDYCIRVPKPRRSMLKATQKNDVKKVLKNADAVCFDVDSTVCTDEGIDELAAFCGVKDEVERMTSRAMNGGLTFRKALSDRLSIMKPSLDDIVTYVREHPPKLTEGIRELVSLLQERGTHVYLVSGGFESLIQPVADELNIPHQNIFANRLMFFHDGEHAGFDADAPTSESGGKIRVVEHLKSRFGYSNLAFIGDGATDLETMPSVEAFIGFGGNKVRENIKAGAPWYVHSFQEIIDVISENS